jgi:hypothetical protein
MHLAVELGVGHAADMVALSTASNASATKLVFVNQRDQLQSIQC